MSDDGLDLQATPVGFAMETLGIDLHQWQADILTWFEPSLERMVMGTVATPNGAGKDAVVIATLALWWVSVHKRGRVVITSADARQIDEQTYPAMSRHQSKFQGWRFLERYIETPTGGKIILFTTDNAGKAEGWHKDTLANGEPDPDGPLLIIANEAKSIAEEIFTALDRCTYNALLYASSPGSMHGRFFESHSNASQLGFKAMQVGLADCPHIPKDKINRITAQHGPDSPVTRSILHGEFMLADGETKFDRQGLEYLRKMAEDVDGDPNRKWKGPGKIGRLEQSNATGSVTFIEDEDGWLWMDEDRIPGCSYMISCDPNKCEQAEGTSDRDNTACGVLRQFYLTAEGEEKKEQMVACLHDQRGESNRGVKWDSDTVARRMKLMSDYFGRCMAVIEENNFGSALIKECQFQGIPLWRRTKTDDINPNKELKIVGYSSSAKTREWWVQKCSAAVRDKSLVCRYKPAVDEFSTFITLPNGRAEAIAGKHDDWVAMLGIGLVVQCYSMLPKVQRMVAQPGWGGGGYAAAESVGSKGSGALG